MRPSASPTAEAWPASLRTPSNVPVTCSFIVARRSAIGPGVALSLRPRKLFAARWARSSHQASDERDRTGSSPDGKDGRGLTREPDSTLTPYTAAPTPAAASAGRPIAQPRPPATPASTRAQGSRISSRSPMRSEVRHDGCEDLVDGSRVAGVVRGRSGCLSDSGQRGEVGVLSVGDGKDPNRPLLSGPLQLADEAAKVLVLRIFIPAVGEEDDGVDPLGIEGRLHLLACRTDRGVKRGPFL